MLIKVDRKTSQVIEIEKTKIHPANMDRLAAMIADWAIKREVNKKKDAAN